MRAFLKNNRQAPRKVRLIARSVIGKNVTVAINELTFMPNKGALTLKKLILSAVANAKQLDANIQDEYLMIKNITVNKGTTYVRYMPRAFGRASPIHKENSHIQVELSNVKGNIPTTQKVVAIKKDSNEDIKNKEVKEEKKTEEKEKKETKTEKTTDKK
jgi:large subunit ribosomal protein L22